MYQLITLLNEESQNANQRIIQMSHLSYITEHRAENDILDRFWNQFDCQERGVYSLLDAASHLFKIND